MGAHLTMAAFDHATMDAAADLGASDDHGLERRRRRSRMGRPSYDNISAGMGWELLLYARSSRA